MDPPDGAPVTGERFGGLRSLFGGLLLAVLLAVPITAGVAGSYGRPTLASLAPVILALRDLGRWLALWWPGHAGGLAVAVTAMALAATAWWALGRGSSRPHAQVWPLCAAAAAVASAAAPSGRWLVASGAALALAVLAGPGRAVSRSVTELGWSRQLLLAVLVLAAVLRFVLLADHPLGFGTHGVIHLGMSVDLVDRIVFGPQALGGRFDPTVFLVEQHGPMAVVNALGFLLFGVGFVQARLTQALLGVVTVWLAFLFGRRLADDRVGLVLAFLVAVSPWHVTISRFNDAEHVLAPLQALLAFWAVLRADRDRTVGAFACAGLACAFGWYIYATNQALLVALVGFFGWRIGLTARGLRRHGFGLLVFAAVFVAASLPHLVTSVRAGRPIPIRSGYQLGGQGLYAVTALEKVPANLRAAVESLVLRADDPWYTKPSGGGLDPLPAVLLPGGLAWCVLALVRRGLRSRAVLLLLWAGAGLVPAVLLSQVEFRRLIQLELAAEVMAAVLVVEIAGLAAATRAGRRALWVAVPVVAAAWIGVATFICWDRVQVPESNGSTYWVELAAELRGHVDRGPVVVVLAANGDLAPEHRAAVRLALHDRQRALARTGLSLDSLVRTAAVPDLASTVEALAQPGRPVRVVAAWALADPGLDRVIRELVPGARRERVVDALGRPTLATWTLPARSGPPETEGPAAGGGEPG